MPPVFITGLPRVGSTLVYQALARGFEVSYVCNAASLVPTAAATVTEILNRVWNITPPHDFTSRYGATSGWNGPSQCWEVWARWFPADQSYAGRNFLGEDAIDQMRATVGAIENSFGAPFVNKSQGHAIRLQPLIAAFPDAVIVEVRRQPLAVASSILRGRREFFGSDEHWFSAKPSNFADLADLPPPAQIAGQMAAIKEDFERDLGAVGAHRRFPIAYKDFCADPRQVVDDFSRFYTTRTGHQLTTRFPIPDSFKRSTPDQLGQSDREALRTALDAVGLLD